MMGYTVGQVAEFSGLTVRTLHHYDEIGLLRPAGRSGAGYRLYRDADLDRLQRIRCYRELGFGLDTIASILDDPTIDTLTHLRHQHELLTNRVGQLQVMVTAVQKMMEAQQMGIALTPEERFEVFGADDPARYAEEAEARWGQTDAYRQSQRRTSSYRKSDWAEITAEQQQVQTALADAHSGGFPAVSVQAMAAAEAHRRHIHRRFYDCPPEQHKALGDMYVADERFTAIYEKVAPGLTQYVRDAIYANAEQPRPGA